MTRRLRDPASAQEQAAAGKIILRVPEIVVVETFYTLTAPVMKIPRAAAARQLSALWQQPGMDVENFIRGFDTLALCETKTIDCGDAALMVFAQSTVPPFPILSFDQDFRKAPAVTAFSQIEWLQKGRWLLK